MNKKPLYLVKIGGSIITDTKRSSTARIPNIDRLADELKRAVQDGKIRVIVGHGSGSFGHVAASRYKTHLGLINSSSMKGAAITQRKAAELHRIVLNEFMKRGLNVLSYPPSAGCVAERGTIKAWNLEPIKIALDNGFLPVVYGDVVVDRKQGISIVSTEEALRYIAKKLKPKRIIVAADTDGIFDMNPKDNSKARLIRSINAANIRSALRGASGSKKIDVTGGMHTKLRYLYGMSRSSGAICEIINGNSRGRLYSALSGEKTVRTVIDGKKR